MQIRPHPPPEEGAVAKDGARIVGYPVGWLKRCVGAGVALWAVGMLAPICICAGTDAPCSKKLSVISAKKLLEFVEMAVNDQAIAVVCMEETPPMM